MGKGETAEKLVGAADLNQEQKQMILGDTADKLFS